VTPIILTDQLCINVFQEATKRPGKSAKTTDQRQLLAGDVAKHSKK